MPADTPALSSLARTVAAEMLRQGMDRSAALLRLGTLVDRAVSAAEREVRRDG